MYTLLQIFHLLPSFSDLLIYHASNDSDSDFGGYVDESDSEGDSLTDNSNRPRLLT